MGVVGLVVLRCAGAESGWVMTFEPCARGGSCNSVQLLSGKGHFIL